MTDRLTQALALVALAAGMLGAAMALGIVVPTLGAAMAIASTIVAGLGIALALGIIR